MSFKSLKMKLVGMSIFGVIILAVGSLYVFQGLVEKEKNTLLDSFKLNAIYISEAISAQFYERYGDIQAFSKNYAFQVNNPELITDSLNKYIELYGIYDVILFVDTDGNPVAHNTIDVSGNPIKNSLTGKENYKNAAWFKSAIKEEYTESYDKGFRGTFVEDVSFDKISSKVYGKSMYGNSFTTSVKDKNGKILGVLTSRANFNWVENEIINVYSILESQGLGSSEITLLDKFGRMIIDYDPSLNNNNREIIRNTDYLLKLNLVEDGVRAAKEAKSGKIGSIISFHARKKIDQVSGFAPISGPKFLNAIGWSVLVRVDAAEIFSILKNTEILFYSSTLIVFLVSILLAWFFSNKLALSISSVSNGINESVDYLGTASSDLSSASQQLSSSATEAASSLQETVSSLEEVTSMVQTNSQNAAEAASLSKNSSQVATEGDSEIRNLIESITEISDSSKKIEEIINVIDDIAFQTNLLSLNAAVEAARAGEQGKGFAVVADAVRTLAQRSAKAAKEITELIKENVTKIEKGTRTADKSGQVLKDILVSVKKVADINNEIAVAGKEQSIGLSQISTAMNELDVATQRNAVSSDQVATSSEKLLNQANTLKDTANHLNKIIRGSDESDGNLSTGPNKTNIEYLEKARKKKNLSLVTKPEITRNISESPESVIPFEEDKDQKPKVGTTDGF